MPESLEGILELCEDVTSQNAFFSTDILEQIFFCLFFERGKFSNQIKIALN